MVTISRDTAKRAEDYVTKYMGLLQIEGPRPSIQWFDDPKPDWLGRTNTRLGRGEARSTIELQKMLLRFDESELERTIAHEMIHVRDDRDKTVRQLARQSSKPQAHVASFYEGAGRINEIMGPDFVRKEAVLVRSGTRSTRSAITVGFVGVGLLGVLLWQKLRSGAHDNARGNYGPSAQRPSSAPRGNERGNYGG